MMEATLRSRAMTLSWEVGLDEERDVEVASEKERSKQKAAPRREPTADDMRAVVEEAENVEARVRTRSKRMRAPSASPDEPHAGPASESITPPPPPAGGTLPSMPAARSPKESGRYSFVSSPRRDRKNK